MGGTARGPAPFAALLIPLLHGIPRGRRQPAYLLYWYIWFFLRHADVTSSYYAEHECCPFSIAKTNGLQTVRSEDISEDSRAATGVLVHAAMAVHAATTTAGAW